MKNRLLLTLLSVLALGAGSFAAEDKDETPLSKEMTQMNKSLRTIKRNLADPSKKAENLELLEKIKKNLDAEHNLDPKKTKEQTDKPAYTKKFKDEIIELGKAFGELEAAIKVDKADEAKAALEKISKLKEKGHKDFGVDDD